MANQPKKYTKFVATAATATLVASAIVPVASAAGFSDVSETNSHAEHINALVEAGIIQGYPDGTFKPNQELTRGQVVKMLGKWVEAQGFEIPADYATKARFTDVAVDAKDQELVKYAALVADTKVFIGSNGELNAAGKITRENMALVLDRAFTAINEVSLVKLAADIEDVKVEDLAKAKKEAQEAIQALRDLGITVVENFNPKNTVTRGQFASFLNKTINTSAELTVKEVVAVDANTLEVTLSDNKKHTVKLEKALEANVATEVTFKIEDKEYTATVTFKVDAPVVKAINATQVVVTFGQAVDKDTVIDSTTKQVKNVTFKSLDDKDVVTTNTKAELSKDGKVLTITSINGKVFEGRYDVTIDGVKTKEGKAVEKFEAKNLDFGKDTVAPTIVGTEKVNASTVKVNFSEPLSTEGNWTFTDAEGKAVAVTKSFTSGDSAVVLTIGSDVKAGTEITATFIGAKDQVGNLINPNPTSVKFIKGDKDGVAPVVSTVTATALNKFEIKFSEEVQNLSVANIYVGGVALTSADTVEIDETDKTKYVVTLGADKAAGLHKVEVKESAIPAKVTDLSGEELTAFSQLVEFKADKVAPKFVKSEIVVDATTKEEKLVLTFDKEVTNTSLAGIAATELNSALVTKEGTLAGQLVVNKDNKKQLEVALKSVQFAGAALVKDATYTVKFAKGAIADTNTTPNTTEAFTVTFKRGVDGVATTTEKPAVTSVTASPDTITVVFDKEVEGTTATNVANYTIAGLTIESAILKADAKGVANTVVLSLKKGTNTLNGARDLAIANVAAKNGAVMTATTKTVNMLENVAPVVSKAVFSNTDSTGKVSEITLTFSEDVTVDANAFEVFVGDATVAEKTTTTAVTTAAKEVKIQLSEGLTAEQIAKTISVKLASAKNVKDVNGNALSLTSINATK